MSMGDRNPLTIATSPLVRSESLGGRRGLGRVRVVAREATPLLLALRIA
jgi:hypothetical protein